FKHFRQAETALDNDIERLVGFAFHHQRLVFGDMAARHRLFDMREFARAQIGADLRSAKRADIAGRSPTCGKAVPRLFITLRTNNFVSWRSASRSPTFHVT